MNKRLYVGNLSYDTSQADLEAAFAPYGGSGVTLPLDHDGRSKGFGFVEVDESQMEAAIAGMDGKQLGGRSLTVNEARPRTERGGTGPRSGYGGRGRGW